MMFKPNPRNFDKSQSQMTHNKDFRFWFQVKMIKADYNCYGVAITKLGKNWILEINPYIYDQLNNLLKCQDIQLMVMVNNFVSRRRYKLQPTTY